jgi:hypothetical protein
MTTTTTIQPVYLGQAVAIDVECFQEDGTSPMDLSTGEVHLRLSRGGLTPFEIDASSEDATGFAWTDRATGKGSFTIDTSLLPPGHCRYRLTSVSGGQPALQALGWMKLSGAV